MNCQQQRCFSTRPLVKGEECILLDLIRELAEFEGNTTNAQKIKVEDLDSSFFQSEFVEMDGEVVGYAIYYWGFSANKGKPILFLEDLYVKPEKRRLGAGRALMNKLKRYASEKGCCYLSWHVFGWNTKAKDFYKSLEAEFKSELELMRIEI